MPEASNVRVVANGTTESFVLMSGEQFAAHVAHVETVVNLVEKMMVALANNPMFAGFLPPDLQREIKGL